MKTCANPGCGRELRGPFRMTCSSPCRARVLELAGRWVDDREPKGPSILPHPVLPPGASAAVEVVAARRSSSSPNRGRRFLADPLTRAEVDALLRRCNVRYPTGSRNRALLVLLWRTGLRVGEAVALHPRDLDREAGTVRVQQGKGCKPRTVPMDAGAWSVVDRWLEARKVLGIRGGPVFCTLRGGQLTTNYVREMVHRLAERARIQRRVHPHAFRHTYAAELEREGVSVARVSALLGHSNLAVTSTYLRSVGVAAELVDVVRARPAW